MQNKSISEQLRIRVALLSDLQHTPHVCPGCGAESVERGALAEVCFGLIEREAHCTECGVKWFESFEFSRASNDMSQRFPTPEQSCT